MTKRKIRIDFEIDPVNEFDCGDCPYQKTAWCGLFNNKLFAGRLRQCREAEVYFAKTFGYDEA